MLIRQRVDNDMITYPVISVSVYVAFVGIVTIVAVLCVASLPLCNLAINDKSFRVMGKSYYRALTCRVLINIDLLVKTDGQVMTTLHQWHA